MAVHISERSSWLECVADQSLFGNPESACCEQGRSLLQERVAAAKMWLQDIEQDRSDVQLAETRALPHLPHIDAAQAPAVLKTLEDPRVANGEESLRERCQLMDDLLRYLTEILRQIRCFDRAIVTREKLPDSCEDVKEKIAQMTDLLGQCIDAPLAVLEALRESTDQPVIPLPGNMPGYYLDTPSEPDFFFVRRGPAPERLSQKHLLPIYFAEREQCAIEGHEVTLRARKALDRPGGNTGLAECLQNIDNCFIALCYDSCLKRGEKLASIFTSDKHPDLPACDRG